MHIRKQIEARLNELALRYGKKNGAKVANDCLGRCLDAWENVERNVCLLMVEQDRSLWQEMGLKGKFKPELPYLREVERGDAPVTAPRRSSAKRADLKLVV